jgi:hypothetical protein
MTRTEEIIDDLQNSLEIARSRSNLFEKEYYKSVLELQNANKGIKRLHKKLQRYKKTGFPLDVVGRPYRTVVPVSHGMADLNKSATKETVPLDKRARIGGE